MTNGSGAIAYFTMEIALESGMGTYSGGLGVLAGDTARSAADLKLPLVVVSLLYRKGFFRQTVDEMGNQHESPAEWNIENHLKDSGTWIKLELSERTVHVRAWRYDVKGISGGIVPVYFLDTDCDQNDPLDRALSHQLYGGDRDYRLRQEAVLGIGGIRILRALGYKDVHRFHMNEGHASLLALELLNERLAAEGRHHVEATDIELIRGQCVFTTHTPVEAGHDRFQQSQMERVLGKHEAFNVEGGFCSDGICNMTHLGFNMSSFVNGVARKHREVTREMFDDYSIDSVTNGVHAGTFVSPPMAKLFDKYIHAWREDNFSLRYAMNIPHHELWDAHCEAKGLLLDYVKEKTGQELSSKIFTLGFARRVTAYKRADLLFHDIKRLKQIAKRSDGLQVLFAGKAHPQDEAGKDLIRKVCKARDELKGVVSVVFLENYDLELGKLITAGVDVWLNTPQPPLEASGTSGMKAALNGVPSFSVLDGWWIEGWIEGVTGWSIAADDPEVVHEHDTQTEATSLYNKLEHILLPVFYRDRVRFQDIMRQAIALNGSFFNTERMVKEYVVKAYFGSGNGQH